MENLNSEDLQKMNDHLVDLRITIGRLNQCMEQCRTLFNQACEQQALIAGILAAHTSPHQRTDD